MVNVSKSQQPNQRLKKLNVTNGSSTERDNPAPVVGSHLAANQKCKLVQ